MIGERVAYAEAVLISQILNVSLLLIMFYVYRNCSIVTDVTLAYFGVSSPHRRAAVKPVLQSFVRVATPQSVVAVIDALWSQYSEREMPYTALDIMIETQRMWTAPSAADCAPLLRDCFLRCMGKLPWWDTIDILASNGWGPLALAHPLAVRETLDRFVDSSNVWERRVAILHQLKYKERTDEKLLFDIIRRRELDKEFWIRKAIGWALRTYRRTAKERVEQFVEQEKELLSPLSIREALK